MTTKQLYPTFILPAPNGCNLHCPYCIIDKRKEANHTELTGHDYTSFLEDILYAFKISKVSLQGFEPLLPEIWHLSKQMLLTACQYGCETSLVTNGVYLEEIAPEISGRLGILDSITVSLDSHDPAKHDKMRGSVGAFEQAVRGIRSLSRFHGIIKVNSVLFPGKSDRLLELPQLLVDIGVTEWALSPYLEIGNQSSVPRSEQLNVDLNRLITEADKVGLLVYLSDELRQLEGSNLFDDFYLRTLPQKSEVFRLSPDGTCSRGIEVLHQSSVAPIWNTREKPADFLTRIFSDCGVQIQKRTSLEKRWYSFMTKGKEVM